jgi:hypothetical protein
MALISASLLSFAWKLVTWKRAKTIRNGSAAFPRGKQAKGPKFDGAQKKRGQDRINVYFPRRDLKTITGTMTWIAALSVRCSLEAVADVVCC